MYLKLRKQYVNLTIISVFFSVLVGLTAEVEENQGLSNGLDSSGIVWVTSTEYPWENQIEESFDGEDAVASYGPGDYSSSTISTEIEGPGILSYYWKVSSEERFDYLVLFVDGIHRKSISGEKDWEEVTVFLDEGSHKVEFAYQRDETISAGEDRGWIDQFSFSEGNGIPAPEITVALGLEELEWATSAYAPWSLISEFNGLRTFAGSYPLDSAGQDSWIETKITGPAIVSMDFKIDRLSAFAHEFKFGVDGELEPATPGFLPSFSWERATKYIPKGQHEFRIQFSIKDSTVFQPDSLLIRNMLIQYPKSGTVSIAEAFDSPEQSFSSEENRDNYNYFGSWVGIADQEEDFVVSPITFYNSESEVLKTTVVGPAGISFYWKASSQVNIDKGYFYLNGEKNTSISGSTDWENVVVSVPAGTHELGWVFVRNGFQNNGDDAIYLDRFQVLASQEEKNPFLIIQYHSGEVVLSASDLSDSNYNLWAASSIDGPFELVEESIESQSLISGYKIETDADIKFFKLSVQE